MCIALLVERPTYDAGDDGGFSGNASGNLFAADYSTSNPMVEEYNSSGTLIRQWNGPGGTYFGPDGVAWFGSLLYVADYDNNAVYSLTP